MYGRQVFGGSVQSCSTQQFITAYLSGKIHTYEYFLLVCQAGYNFSCTFYFRILNRYHMLLNLMWVSLVDPWLWQIIAHIFRNLPGGPTMWLYEDHIACMKKIIQVSTSTYFNFWCKLICIEYILTVRRIDVRNSYSYDDAIFQI